MKLRNSVLSSILGTTLLLPLASQAGEKELSARLDNVIVHNPVKADGTTTSARVLSIFKQLSAAYETKYKAPLPLFFDMPAAEAISLGHTVVPDVTGLVMHDVPLKDDLRYWCELMGLTYQIKNSGILISVKP